jgi:hypothetical protein
MNEDLAAALPSLLPHAIDWAVAQEQLGASTGSSLDEPDINIALAVGVRVPARIRVCVVADLPMPLEPRLQRAALQAGLLGPGMVGLTLGYTVFVRGAQHLQPRLLRHEFRHVQQYEAAGSIAAFLAAYLPQIIQFGYENAPLEVDARAHEQ